MKALTLESIAARSIEDGDCLLWDRSTDTKGIPRMTVKLEDGKATTVQIRRAVWELKTGKKVPAGMRVTVSCGRKLCLEHLELIPPGEVVSRTAQRADVQSKRVLAGLKSRERAKLDMETARYIREDDKTGAAIAQELGIAATTVSRVRRGVAWRESSNPFVGLGA
jgi:hypothetical protein